jgi:uncharacterized membrane protein YcfT
MMNGKQRLDWVDMAKGLSILLVVIMYCASSVGKDTGGTGFLHWVMAFAMPFRMPEFFLISGLFLGQVIQRPWRAYADRRVVHYLYFYVLWATIHILFKTALLEGDLSGASAALVQAIYEPYGVWWFVYMLALFGLVSKICHNAKIPHGVVLAVAAGLQVASIHTGSYLVDQFAAYFIYFHAGYVFAPWLFRLAAWSQANRGAAGLGLAAWAAVNAVLVFTPGFHLDPVHIRMGWAELPVVHLLSAFAGAVAVIVTASLLVSIPWMAWLRWLGAKSLIIYVAFVLPMGIARTLLLKLGIEEPNLVSLAIMIAAIGSPLVLWRFTQEIGFGRFLFERPRWAHLRGTAPSGEPSVHPAAAE